MSEVTLQWVQGLKIFLIGAYSLLYGFGGVRGKYKRRIIAPAVYTAGIAGFSLWTGSFHWSYLLCFLLLWVSLSIGYGSDETKVKILKRSRYGLACALSSLPVFIVSGAYSLLALHILICVATSTVAGVWNQTSSARAEESLIGATTILIPMFTI